MACGQLEGYALDSLLFLLSLPWKGLRKRCLVARVLGCDCFGFLAFLWSGGMKVVCFSTYACTEMHAHGLWSFQEERGAYTLGMECERDNFLELIKFKRICAWMEGMEL